MQIPGKLRNTYQLQISSANLQAWELPASHLKKDAKILKVFKTLGF